MKTKKLLLAASLMLCVSGQVMAQDESGFDISARDLLVPNRLAATSSLRYADGEYHLTLDGTERQVASYNVRGVPAVSEEQLEEVLKHGYFSVGGSETEPTLEWKGRVLGGMPILNAHDAMRMHQNTKGWPWWIQWPLVGWAYSWK